MNQWLTTTFDDERRISPMRAVMHPAWILAVFVLIVNDHVLKPAAWMEPLTGKLSDLAGLFLFPVLLAAILGVRTRRGLARAGFATGVVFAAINLSPTLAAWFDAAVSVLTPFTTTPDPTDLIALIAIPVALWCFDGVMARTNARTTRRALEATAATIGGLACMATSTQPCDDCFALQQTAQVSILNKTNELHILRLRPLRAGVLIDCDTVESDPSTYLVDAAFGPPQSWYVQSGQEIPVNPVSVDEFGQEIASNDNRCSAVLVQSDTVPDILIFWNEDLQSKTFPFDVDVPREIPADGQTVVLDADYARADQTEMHEWRERSDCGERADLCSDEVLAPLATIPTGARYFWRSQHDTPLHFARSTTPQGTLPDVTSECMQPTANDGLAWEPPPTQELYVLDVDEGRDGCHEVLLTSDPNNPDLAPIGWWVCAPFGALEALLPQPGVQKRLQLAIENAPSRFESRGDGETLNVGGYTGLKMSVLGIPDAGPTTYDTIHLTRGYSLPEEVDVQPRFSAVEGCEPIETICGQIALPADMEMLAYGEHLRPGEDIEVGVVAPLHVFLVRADYRPIVDATCDQEAGYNLAPQYIDGPVGYMEAAIVRHNEGR